MINFADSTFSRIIIHRIFAKTREEEYSSVEHEDQLTITTPEVRTIIKKRINKACGKRSKSFELHIVNDAPGSFFNLAKDITDVDDKEFIEKSKQIATLLGKAQRHSIISEGFLIIIDGKTNNDKGFALVIKAELQEAFKRTTDPSTQQKQIEILRDIFLSPSEKFFKIGILCESKDPGESYPNSDFSCLVHDDQFRPGTVPAEYFVDDFLGFSTEKNSKLLSRGFYKATKLVIEKSEIGFQQKQNCLEMLDSVYKEEQTGIINPMEFGEKYLPSELRNAFATEILSQPRFNRPFVKNLDLMKREFLSKTMKFKNKVVVKAPPAVFDESIKVVESIEEAQEVLDNPNVTLLRIEGTPYSNV